MKRLLLPLLAALALPTAANAESVWLILRYGTTGGKNSGSALEKIKMKDKEQCELMGARWMGAKPTKAELKSNYQPKNFGYVCLEGE